MFYAKSTNGFYDPAINGQMPSDALQITQAQHDALLLGQQAGQIIAADPNGLPVLTAYAPTPAQAWAAYQAQALAALGESDKTMLRCLENAVPVPAIWAQYRKTLRAIVGAASGTPGALPAVPAYPAGT